MNGNRYSRLGDSEKLQIALNELVESGELQQADSLYMLAYSSKENEHDCLNDYKRDLLDRRNHDASESIEDQASKFEQHLTLIQTLQELGQEFRSIPKPDYPQRHKTMGVNDEVSYLLTIIAKTSQAYGAWFDSFKSWMVDWNSDPFAKASTGNVNLGLVNEIRGIMNAALITYKAIPKAQLIDSNDSEAIRASSNRIELMHQYIESMSVRIERLKRTDLLISEMFKILNDTIDQYSFPKFDRNGRQIYERSAWMQYRSDYETNGWGIPANQVDWLDRAATKFQNPKEVVDYDAYGKGTVTKTESIGRAYF